MNFNLLPILAGTGLALLAGAVLTVPCAASSFSGKVTGDPGAEISFGLDHQKGNTDAVGLNVGATHIVPVGEHRLASAGEFSYGETDDEKKTDKGKVKSVYSIPISERLYLALGLEGSYDDIADVRYRVIAGPPNLGYRFVSTDRLQVVGELGGGYLWEEVGGVKQEFPVLQVRERAELILSETAKVWQSVEFLPEADDFDNYLLEAEAGIQSQLNEHLDLRLVTRNSFDSQPAEGKRRNDIQTHAALVLHF